MVWSPLGQGPLTGKYPAGQAPPRTGANRSRPSARPRGPRGEARLESVEIQWHRLFMGFLVSCEGRWGGAPVCAPPPAHKPVSAPSAYADSARYWSVPTFSATRLKKGAFTPSASVLQATSSVPAPPNAAWPIREILSLSFASLGSRLAGLALLALRPLRAGQASLAPVERGLGGLALGDRGVDDTQRAARLRVAAVDDAVAAGDRGVGGSGQAGGHDCADEPELRGTDDAAHVISPFDRETRAQAIG